MTFGDVLRFAMEPKTSTGVETMCSWIERDASEEQMWAIYNEWKRASGRQCSGDALSDLLAECKALVANGASREKVVEAIREAVEHPEPVALMRRNLCIILREAWKQKNSAVNAPGPQANTGFVYLMESGGYFKVGQTRELHGRLQQITTLMPHPVRVLAVIHTSQPDREERYWHTYFASYRMNGEWFALHQEHLEEFARAALKGGALSGDDYR